MAQRRRPAQTEREWWALLKSKDKTVIRSMKDWKAALADPKRNPLKGCTPSAVKHFTQNLKFVKSVPRAARVRALCVLSVLTVSTVSIGQSATQQTGTTQQTTQPAAPGNSAGAATTGAGNPGTDAGKTKTQDPGPANSSSSDQKLDDVQRTLKQIQDDMAANKDSEWGLVLGIGSLLLAPGVTDYQNQSNVLSAVHLGKATPQLLTGVSFRTHIPSLLTRFRCDVPAGGSKPTAASSQTSCTRFDKKKNSFDQGTIKGETWQRMPWSAFVSLKFAPGASNPINGYVLGGAFSIAAHLDVRVGFALPPVSEPAPGFRTVAAQFVQSEQQQGKYLNFNANNMLNNAANAFDGFPTTNPSTGALIYPGNPLTTHYRGGVVIGVSLPIAFSSFLKNGTSAPPTTPTPSVAPTSSAPATSSATPKQ